MNTPPSDNTAIIVGGGPAGLMAAEVLSERGVRVHVYDGMPSVGRKLLMAGKSGLNLTHAEPYSSFVQRFGSQNARLRPYLDMFPPDQLRDWAKKLGIETFTGSSGRVFPTAFKASPLLRAWLRRLDDNGVKFHLQHKWLGWNDKEQLEFQTPESLITVDANTVIFALGGASWPRLGSDAMWLPAFKERRIDLTPFKPANCGFNVDWSDHFQERFAGEPVKSVRLTHGDSFKKGDFVISRDGIEGSTVYAVSASLRDALLQTGQATLTIDLKPDFSEEQLAKRLAKPRGKNSLTNHLRKTVGLTGVKAGLVRECLPKDTLENPNLFAHGLKNLPIQIRSTRPIEEAISCAGGVSLAALDDSLMVKAYPGIFCAGEMLDWEAPTGGYLLTACFATGKAAGLGALKWLRRRNNG